MPEMPPSNYARCSGMHAKQYWVSFGDNYMAVNLQLDKKHWMAPQYCDSDSLLGETDPRRLYFDNDRGRQEAVIKEYE